MGDSHVNLSEIARETRDYPAAQGHAQQALTIYEKLAMPRYIANAHLQVAATLRNAGRDDEALARLRTGFAIAEPLGSTSLMENYYSEFAALAKARGDWHAAYEAERHEASLLEIEAAAADENVRARSRRHSPARATAPATHAGAQPAAVGRPGTGPD